MGVISFAELPPPRFFLKGFIKVSYRNISDSFKAQR
jgi:hypothetical protein